MSKQITNFEEFAQLPVGTKVYEEGPFGDIDRWEKTADNTWTPYEMTDWQQEVWDAGKDAGFAFTDDLFQRAIEAEAIFVAETDEEATSQVVAA